MKKVLIISAIAAVAFIYSCKKDSSSENPSSEKNPLSAQKSTTQAAGQSKKGHRLSEKEIKDITDRQTKEFLAKYKQGKQQSKMGGCPYITEINPIIIGDDHACGSPAGVTVEFLVNIFEEGSYNYTRSFYEDMGGLITNGTITNESMTLLCPDWNPGQQSGECPRRISYIVTCLTPFWGSIVDINFNTLTTCGSAHGNPPPAPLTDTKIINLWACGSPAVCQAFYTSNPAVVVILPVGSAVGAPTPGTFQVQTPCSDILCYGPYTFCPTSITMEYRRVISNPNTGAWIPSIGIGFGIQSGTYEFRNCILNYVTGNQSPFTGSTLPSVGIGTFVVL